MDSLVVSHSPACRTMVTIIFPPLWWHNPPPPPPLDKVKCKVHSRTERATDTHTHTHIVVVVVVIVIRQSVGVCVWDSIYPKVSDLKRSHTHRPADRQSQHQAAPASTTLTLARSLALITETSDAHLLLPKTLLRILSSR